MFRFFTLKKIKAANTNITANEGDKKISLFLQNLDADELSTSADQKPYIAGLIANGNDLNIDNGSTDLNIKTIRLTDHQAFFFRKYTV